MPINLLLCAFLCLCLQSCGDDAPKQKLLEKGRFLLKKTIEFILTDENQAQPIRLELSDREAIVTFDKGKQRLLGQYTHPERIVYLNHLGDILAYIRYASDGFSLYNADKKPIWHVKILADKLQISDNPQNNSPHEIRLADNGGYKVFANSNKLIGEITCKQGKLTAKGNRRYETPLKANHPSFGLLLLNEVQEEYRLIIWTELLRF